MLDYSYSNYAKPTYVWAIKFLHVVHSLSQTRIGHGCHTSEYYGYQCHTHRGLLYHACILDDSTSHSDWSWLTYPMQTEIRNARTDEANMLKSLSCSLHCSWKCYSCPGLLLAMMLTCDSGSPNSSCNCDCGASLVETEPFSGGKGGTLKWRLCPISLSTTWLLWKEKWCQMFLFLFMQQQL